jgi:hypothetical protein
MRRQGIDNTVLVRRNVFVRFSYEYANSLMFQYGSLLGTSVARTGRRDRGFESRFGHGCLVFVLCVHFSVLFLATS